METKLLLGKTVSEHIKNELSHNIKNLQNNNIIPGLAAIIVGDDPASKVYVRNKSKAFKNNYCYSETFSLPNDVSEKDCDLFAIAFTNKRGKEIKRIDANESEVCALLTSASEGDGFLRIWREFHVIDTPKTWIVWPHSKSKGFLERIEKDL